MSDKMWNLEPIKDSLKVGQPLTQLAILLAATKVSRFKGGGAELDRKVGLRAAA